jgi:ABC-type transport system involved in Fe-S cluster assembly fused permease/ATPase subunit
MLVPSGSTVVNSDLIVVLKDGDIAEKGSHPELMKNGALYATLARQQGL